MEKYQEVADFVLVYIAEAHPSDGWAFQGNLDIDQHKSMDERRKAAQMLVDLHPLNCKILIDRMTDEANKAYAAFPERLYIVQDGIVAYKGGPGPFEYKVDEVDSFLKRYQKAQ